jgi:hypothetical protein
MPRAVGPGPGPGRPLGWAWALGIFPLAAGREWPDAPTEPRARTQLGRLGSASAAALGITAPLPPWPPQYLQSAPHECAPSSCCLIASLDVSGHGSVHAGASSASEPEVGSVASTLLRHAITMAPPSELPRSRRVPNAARGALPLAQHIASFMTTGNGPDSNLSPSHCKPVVSHAD